MGMLIQNILLAGLYGIVATAILRSGMHFPLLFVYCTLAVPYELFWEFLGRQGSLLMLGLLMVAVFECGWKATGPDTTFRRITLAWAAFAIGCGTGLVLSAARVSYISTTVAITGGAFIGLLLLNLTDFTVKLRCNSAARVNLRLMCVWMGFWSAGTASYDLYNSRSVWMAIGWAWLAGLAAIALTYWRRLQRIHKPG